MLKNKADTGNQLMNIKDVPYYAKLKQHLHRSVAFSIEEDMEDGDITAKLIPIHQKAKAVIIAKEAGVLCGQAWVDEVFSQVDNTVDLHWLMADGERFQPGDTLLEMNGNARSILTSERPALNYLQTLSGTATVSRRYSNAAGSKNIQVLDTRKTIPGLRLAQKYAVRVGGSFNHRLGLYDMFLIKENHIAAAGGIENAVKACAAINPDAPIEVEVENLDEFDIANALPEVDYIMLDEMTEPDSREAMTRVTDDHQLEISGGVKLDRIQDIEPFEKPVRCSSGLLTKAVYPIDLSLRILD